MTEISIPVSARRTWYYRLSQVIVGFLFRLYFRHETRGIQNLPKNKGAVIATNHTSVLDPPLIGVDLPRPVFYMAKQSLHDIPLFGSLIRAYNSFPVKRGGFNRRAMRRAAEVVEKGNLLFLFPEGTRSRDGSLQRFRAGVGKIVLDSQVGVVPGYIDGAFSAWPPESWWPRPFKTSVTFGKYKEYEEFYSEDPTREDYRQVANDIRESVLRLKD